MKFLSSGIENQIILEIKVKGEIIPPSSNIKGRLILDGVLLQDIEIDFTDSTTYFLPIPILDVEKGKIKSLRVQAFCNTPIGIYNFNSIYHIINYFDIPVDYDSIRSKLGVTEEEVNDYELNLENTYLNSFNIFLPALFIDRETDFNVSYLYSRYLIVASAISTLPALMIRLAKKDATENGDFTRLANASDLKDLLDNLKNELADILGLLDDYIEDELAFTPIFQFVTISPDLITGS